MEKAADIFFSRRYRIAWHIIFWALVLLFYTLFFGHQEKQYRFTFYFVAILLPVTAGTMYAFNYYLIPRFLAEKKYLMFTLLSAYTVLASIFLGTLAVFAMLLMFMNGKGDRLDPSAIDIYFLVVGMYFVIIIGIAFRLIRMWYQKQQSAQTLARDKLQAELNMLKSQIHPHFLFNTLNNIYALSLQQSEQAPEMLVRLSEILHYLLYECREETVELQREIELIRDYIELEKIRYGDRLELDLNIRMDPGGRKVAPVLLLPFIENGFKHGASKKRDRVKMMISMELKENVLCFHMENSMSATVLPPGKASVHGLGLENVRKRLEMSYPGHYELKIKTTGELFIVDLQIGLDHLVTNA